MIANKFFESINHTFFFFLNLIKLQDPSFVLPLVYDARYKSVPILAKVYGSINAANFTNEYNFYDFVAKVSEINDFYSVIYFVKI